MSMINNQTGKNGSGNYKMADAFGTADISAFGLDSNAVSTASPMFVRTMSLLTLRHYCYLFNRLRSVKLPLWSHHLQFITSVPYSLVVHHCHWFRWIAGLWKHNWCNRWNRVDSSLTFGIISLPVWRTPSWIFHFRFQPFRLYIIATSFTGTDPWKI